MHLLAASLQALGKQLAPCAVSPVHPVVVAGTLVAKGAAAGAVSLAQIPLRARAAGAAV